MTLWPALILGFAGSMHCAVMCGPLALMLPSGGGSRGSFLAGRVIYNLGRILTYAALGAVFGAIGATLVFAGFQRWISLAAGGAILVGTVAGFGKRGGVPVARLVAFIKSAFSRLLQRRTRGTLFAFGALNGLLPCGLVYVACAGAAATGSVMGGIEFMGVFGLGTLPMMIGIAIGGRAVRLPAGFHPQRFIPATAAVVGALLILRGLSLGIPYVSPELSIAHVDAKSCCSRVAK